MVFAQFSNSVIPAKAGIQQKDYSRSDQNLIFVPPCGDYLINWIPAFAGMTTGT
jgi:hypothetical protein